MENYDTVFNLMSQLVTSVAIGSSCHSVTCFCTVKHRPTHSPHIDVAQVNPPLHIVSLSEIRMRPTLKYGKKHLPLPVLLNYVLPLEQAINTCCQLHSLCHNENWAV